MIPIGKAVELLKSDNVLNTVEFAYLPELTELGLIDAEGITWRGREFLAVVDSIEAEYLNAQ